MLLAPLLAASLRWTDYRRTPPSGRILDLGCGTGILALAIAKRWRRKILAADIDPDAVATCRINARLNKLSPLVRVVESNGFRRGRVAHEAPYGLIIANILARPLIEMAADIRRKIQPGGMVILSGFTEKSRKRRARRLSASRLPSRAKGGFGRMVDLCTGALWG